MSVHSWLGRREVGPTCYQFCKPDKSYPSSNILSWKRLLWKKLYRKHNDVGNDSNIACNGVFGLQYAPNGKLLVAACEKDAIVIIDPLTSKIIKTRENVHTNRCNTVTFIDERLFATCSDDHNVSLWDVRNMKEEVFLMKGHDGWVKNVEFHEPSGKLLSAGFDDKVIAWDINRPLVGGSCSSNVLMQCANLLRMRISPDGESMYLSAVQTADLISIRNLDIDHLLDDVGIILSLGGSSQRSVRFQDFDLPLNRYECPDYQYQPVMRRNHVELYYGYSGDRQDNDVNVLCQSIDIHPENMAVAMRYDRLPSYNSKCLSIHNTWSYYNGPFQGNNSWVIPEEKNDCASSQREIISRLPMPRGLPTNVVDDTGPENTEYIQEIAFSSCGRFIASPCGFGVALYAYDKQASDYRTHIASKLAMQHQWDEGGDAVFPPYLSLTSTELYNVTYCFGHRSMVLSTAFSPTHMQLATGSKEGQVILFEVVL